MDTAYSSYSQNAPGTRRGGGGDGRIGREVIALGQIPTPAKREEGRVSHSPLLPNPHEAAAGRRPRSSPRTGFAPTIPPTRAGQGLSDAPPMAPAGPGCNCTPSQATYQKSHASALVRRGRRALVAAPAAQRRGRRCRHLQGRRRPWRMCVERRRGARARLHPVSVVGALVPYPSFATEPL